MELDTELYISYLNLRFIQILYVPYFKEFR